MSGKTKFAAAAAAVAAGILWLVDHCPAWVGETVVDNMLRVTYQNINNITQMAGHLKSQLY